jgi:hypothetical protein
VNAVLVSMLLCCAPLAADMAQVQAEPNLEKRSHAALELAERSLKASRQAYSAGDLPQASALLDEMKQSVDLAEKSLKQTGKDPIKSPKHFKYAEIKTADLLRRLEAYQQDTNIGDRPMVESAKERVQDVHDRLLHGIMTGKKR